MADSVSVEAGIYERNRSFYDSLWRHVSLRPPEWFNTWPVVEELVQGREHFLEIGPGVRPRLPVARSIFLDLSAEAARKLARGGGRPLRGNLIALPFPSGAFDAVCALDVIEHASDQEAVFSELGRVLKSDGGLLFAVPVHSGAWTEFDRLVGHHVRYDADSLRAILARHGLVVERSATYGILPRSRMALGIGAWVLKRFRGPAAWFEDRLVMPIARRFQKGIEWREGLRIEERAGGIIAVVRRRQ